MSLGPRLIHSAEYDGRQEPYISIRAKLKIADDNRAGSLNQDHGTTSKITARRFEQLGSTDDPVADQLHIRSRGDHQGPVDRVKPFAEMDYRPLSYKLCRLVKDGLDGSRAGTGRDFEYVSVYAGRCHIHGFQKRLGGRRHARRSYRHTNKAYWA